MSPRTWYTTTYANTKILTPPVKVPDAQSKIFDGLIEGKLENLREGLRERFLPPRISPDPHHPHAIDDPLAGMRYELVKILDGLSHDLHADRLNPQNTDEPPLPICCDFQFLRIQNYKNPSFFVPGVPMGTQHVGIMGFCGEPDPTEVLLMLATETELKEKERSGRAILTVLEREREYRRGDEVLCVVWMLIADPRLFLNYHLTLNIYTSKSPFCACTGEMRAGFHNYNNLTVSPATVVDTNSGNLSHPYRLHNGSVSTGASGAPVVRASQPQVFSYMHVSGTPHYVTNPPIQPTSTAVQQGELDEVSLRPDSDRFQNVMISVNHPEYRKLYQEIVWPEIRTIVDAPKFPGDVREALAFYVSNRE
ncbi:hypothetical protein BC938DRAFT_474712 [Jimgerdemannia flammicorona]|uniref:Uncharacterized protein n=1 Tax=Jimgerdemannia flammicorona TaxID=994334 RepID=A0A433Q1N1_9FUNG|nr:hypothetical protein BC938DRAFT_474712 [Jimgerdemannia flammicorona]